MADISITKFRVQIPRNGATPSTPGFAQSEGQDPVNPPGSPTGIYVPYLGATGSVNLGEFGLTSGFVTFDTTPTGTPTSQGTAYWDDARQTVALIMNGTTSRWGQGNYVYCKNNTANQIDKGTNVRGSGTDGASGHILIDLFLANGTYPSESYIGVTAEDIPPGGFGQVQEFGELAKINTSAFSANDLLYVSTTVAGGFQNTVPVAPNNIILVGKAINSKNNGDIFIRPHIGSNIKNDEGVKITSGTAGDLLQLQAGGLWENKSLATIGLHTGTLTANYIPKATGATTLANSKIYEVNDRILINKTTDSGGTLQVNGSIQLSSNVQINNAFGLYFDEDNRIKMDSGFGWDISSWTKTVFSKGNVEISAGTLSTRASSTASAATQIPVFTADPSSTMRAVVTRTPAQLLGDMGGAIKKYLNNSTDVSFSPDSGAFSGVTYGTRTIRYARTGNLANIYIELYTSAITKNTASSFLYVKITGDIGAELYNGSPLYSNMTAIVKHSSNIAFAVNSPNQAEPFNQGSDFILYLYKATDISDIGSRTLINVNDMTYGSSNANFVQIYLSVLFST